MTPNSLNVMRRPPVKRPKIHRQGFTVKELILTLAATALIIALLLPNVRHGRGAMRRTHCRNNLKQIALALHNYAEVYGAFPPLYTVDENGRPLHSWRTLILPHFDQQQIEQHVDLTKPWDHPDNAEALATVVPAYQCPSSTSLPYHTAYMAVVSPDGFFRPAQPRNRADLDEHNGAATVIVEAPAAHAVPWMAPHDITEDALLAIDENTELHHAGGFYALSAHGAVRFLGVDLPPSERRNLLKFIPSDGLEADAEH